MRSQVKCLVCNTESNTYDAMLDISLDINKVNSLDKALELFTKPDYLRDDNMYRCSKCQTKVEARKQLTIFRPPSILTINFKRFEFAKLYGGAKVTKHIHFPLKLDIRKYTSQVFLICMNDNYF